MQKIGYRCILKTDLLLRGHLLNPFWKGRKARHSRREEIQAIIAQKYFKAYYLSGLESLPEDRPERRDDDRIFSIWLQGEQNAPPLVRSCFDSVRRHCGLPLEVMDMKMLENSISLPAVIMDKFKAGAISPAHFADICRIELLHNYGGVWLDSTCYAVSDIPSWMLEEDFFLYLTGPVAGSPYSYVQNCFIRSRKGSYLLEAWRRMILDYWTREDRKFDYFQHQLMFKTMVERDPRSAELFAAMPKLEQDPTHVLWPSAINDRFTPESFETATQGAFFQKLSYKGFSDPVPGTTLYELLNNNSL